MQTQSSSLLLVVREEEVHPHLPGMERCDVFPLGLRELHEWPDHRPRLLGELPGTWGLSSRKHLHELFGHGPLGNAIDEPPRAPERPY